MCPDEQLVHEGISYESLSPHDREEQKEREREERESFPKSAASFPGDALVGERESVYSDPRDAKKRERERETRDERSPGLVLPLSPCLNFLQESSLLLQIYRVWSTLISSSTFSPGSLSPVRSPGRLLPAS